MLERIIEGFNLALSDILKEIELAKQRKEELYPYTSKFFQIYHAAEIYLDKDSLNQYNQKYLDIMGK